MTPIVRSTVRVPHGRCAAPQRTKYCIDRAEVTLGQYRAFVAEMSGKTDQQEMTDCKETNLSFIPNQLADDNGQPRPCGSHYLESPDANPEHSMGCVDYCDAIAFCKWAGKTLCGLHVGQPMNIESATDSSKSLWYNVCSQGGTQKYAYGDIAKFDMCPWINGPSTDSVPPSNESCGSVGQATELPVLDMTSGMAELEISKRSARFSDPAATR